MRYLILSTHVTKYSFIQYTKNNIERYIYEEKGWILYSIR